MFFLLGGVGLVCGFLRFDWRLCVSCWCCLACLVFGFPQVPSEVGFLSVVSFLSDPKVGSFLTDT